MFWANHIVWVAILFPGHLYIESATALSDRLVIAYHREYCHRLFLLLAVLSQRTMSWCLLMLYVATYQRPHKVGLISSREEIGCV